MHDVAPGARLLFAGPGPASRWCPRSTALAAAGAQVIVDDLVFTDEPKFEDGPIAAAARTSRPAAGVYVTAAGNYARAHCFGAYRPRGARAFVGGRYQAFHAFAGDDVGNSLRVPAGRRYLRVLQWNEPFGAGGDDFDLMLAQRAPAATIAARHQHGCRRPAAGTPTRRCAGGTGRRQPVVAYLATAEFRRGDRRSPAARP